MTDLKCAREEMLYLSATHQVSNPTKDWKWPSAEELETYYEKIHELNRSPLTADDFCENGSLGFYMAGESHETAATLAKRIETNYLIDGSFGNPDGRRKRPNNITRQVIVLEENIGRFLYPDVSETVPTGSESDSVRSSSSTSQSFKTTVIASSNENIQSLQNKSCHMNSTRNAIRVIGESVDEILQFLKSDNNLNSNKSDENISIKVPLNLFDKLDLMIFGYLKKTYYESFKCSPLWRKYYEFLYLSTRNVVEDDFAILRILGKGGFGLVKACKRCTTGKMFAIKKLNKKGIKYRKATALCLNERNILVAIRSPFVVCLRYAFTTRTDLYLILDLMTGGDLGFHLSRKGRFSEIETKYYAARTLLGLAAMHEKNIAHRDLKPENILMDEEGYTKISDLGLACKVGKTGLSGTCGTRGYWAPEMLKRDADGKRGRYSVTVDWFSFGCCLFEFMYGCSPFRTDKAHRWGDTPRVEKADRDKAINISIMEMEPDYDERIFNPSLADLISKLLIKDDKKRLGANGFKEIAAHPWFAEIDWDNLEQSKPPSRPSAKDIYTLNESKLGLFVDEKASRKIILTEDDHKLYENWDFVSHCSFEEEIVDLLILQETTVIKPSNIVL